MSNAGRGRSNRIPGMMNGDSVQEVPPDLVWDEDNPPIIFQCSQDVQHDVRCNGHCGSVQLDSELQVTLLNEGRAWARAGMNFKGIPEAYQGVIPVPGINVELVDLLMWLETIKDIVRELSGMSEFEFQEKFREKKLEFLSIIRETNEARVKKQRVANSLGIAKKPIFGPDGNPLQ